MQKYIERLAWGTDAGFYRLVPREIQMPSSAEEVAEIVARAGRESRHLTFRAAGTSLSGQAISDDILVVCGKKWEGYEVLDGGAKIRVQPGVVGGRVNEILRPYGYKFLPDPASINSAMVGGIVMNNASGMSCGTHANAERTILSAKIVFADGTILDTGDPESRKAFSESHPDFLKRIAELRDRVQNDPALKDLILKKYSIKNVTGLTILPFAECEDPFEIITRLMPGSEGTLAFLAEATFRTGKIPAASESALLLFPTTRAACEAVAAMKETGALTAAEFFDRKAMRTVEKDFPQLVGLPEDAGAVLVMTEGSPEEVAEKRAKLEAALAKFDLCTPAAFTGDPKVTGTWWAMRSGIFPAVGGTREIGTTCLIEDVAVPVPRLAEFTDDRLVWLSEFQFSRRQYAAARDAAKELAARGATKEWVQAGNALAGRAYAALSDTNAAIAAFRLAADSPARTKFSSEAALRLGELLAAQGGDAALAEAADYLGEAVSRASAPELAGIRAKAYFALADCTAKRGQKEAAARYCMAVALLFDDKEIVPAALSRAEALYAELGMEREAAAAKAEREARYPAKAEGK